MTLAHATFMSSYRVGKAALTDEQRVWANTEQDQSDFADANCRTREQAAACHPTYGL